MSYVFNPFTGNFDYDASEVSTGTFQAHVTATGTSVHGLGTAALSPTTAFADAGTFAAHVTATGESVHGLGNSSILDTGTTAGTVATGDHAHDSTYLKLDCSNDPLTSNLEVQGSGTFGGTVTGMSTIASGLTVNNAGGGGANDDFIAKSDNYTAFQVDASADQILINVDSVVGDKSFILGTTTGTKIGTATTQKLGLWNATPIVQPATAAYSSDAEGSAYIGIDNAQAGTVYAQLTDLNALRTAYETLRASYDDLLAKLKTTGIVS